MPSRTLYASDDQKRFFHVPDGARLPAGPLVVRSLTGKKLLVEPVAVEIYEIPEAEARMIAAAMVSGFAEKVAAVAGVAVQALNAPPPPADEGRDRQEARIAAALHVSREQLHNDPEAVKAGLAAVLDGLLHAVQDTAERPADARARASDIAEALRQEGADPDVVHAVEAFPELLRERLASDDTLRKIEAAAERLREAAAELRRENDPDA